DEMSTEERSSGASHPPVATTTWLSSSHPTTRVGAVSSGSSGMASAPPTLTIAELLSHEDPTVQAKVPDAGLGWSERIRCPTGPDHTAGEVRSFKLRKWSSGWLFAHCAAYSRLAPSASNASGPNSVPTVENTSFCGCSPVLEDSQISCRL